MLVLFQQYIFKEKTYKNSLLFSQVSVTRRESLRDPCLVFGRNLCFEKHCLQLLATVHVHIGSGG